jgi:hypothetical protein
VLDSAPQDRPLPLMAATSCRLLPCCGDSSAQDTSSVKSLVVSMTLGVVANMTSVTPVSLHVHALSDR